MAAAPQPSYIAIDLKSFYASVECVERGLDPMTTNLVVADASRTPKTICLAAASAIKAYGISGRARLFEVIQKIKEANMLRKANAPRHALEGESFDARELAANPSLAVGYLTAKPRMALYLAYSARIFDIYLRYIAKEDIFAYSIDEVFMDVTPYLSTYRLSAHALALRMMRDVLKETGITATAGIGTNLYLAKIAMDIVAKRMQADKDGVRIAELDEGSYRHQLWGHRPLTDFWRLGRGYAKKLEAHGLRTMGDIARCSLGGPQDFHNEELLYKLFGVNAELLIDHAWGWEPCTMANVKAYRPIANSLSSGQVLQSPYTHEKARLIVWEMTDLLALELVEKGLVADQVVLDIGYDVENMRKTVSGEAYQGEVHIDHYGRAVPKPAHGSVNLGGHTSSSKRMLDAAVDLYDRITDPRLLVRRVTVTANHVIEEGRVPKPKESPEQLNLFTDYEALRREQEQAKREERKEKSLQHAMIDIKRKYGKNAILKGANLQEGAMTMERNRQIGGHKA